MKRTSLVGALAMAAMMGVGSSFASPMVETLHPEPRKTSGATRCPHDRKRDRSRYMPHQGAREIARRLRATPRLESGT